MAQTPAETAYHSITLVFNVKGADAFIAFCKEALGAEECFRRQNPDGTVVHVDLQLGDTRVWVSESIREPPTSAAVTYFVPDCDGTFERAVQSGADVVFHPAVPSWGGRWARVCDAWGNSWTFVARAA